MRTVRTWWRACELIWRNKGFMATALLVAELPSIAFAAFIVATVVLHVFGEDYTLALVAASFAYSGARWLTTSLSDAAIIRYAHPALGGTQPGIARAWRSAFGVAHRVGLFKLAVAAVTYGALYAFGLVVAIVYVVSETLWVTVLAGVAGLLLVAPLLLTVFLWSVYAQQFAAGRDLGVRSAFTKARRHLGSRLRRSLELAVAYAILPALIAALAFVCAGHSNPILVSIGLVLSLLSYAARSLLPATLLAVAVEEDAT